MRYYDLYGTRGTIDELQAAAGAALQDEVLKPEFADCPVLLYASRTDRPDEIQDLLLKIPGLDHLKREML